MWFWQYQLTPRHVLSAIARPGPRRGALIRIGLGVADVHPWPELGDATLDEQLSGLARGVTTPLTASSLRLARVDGQARQAGLSLFAGRAMPENHWLAAAGDVPESFDTVKVKMSRGVQLDPFLERFRLRLDYNAALSAEEFSNEKLPLASIEFVEDPCPFDSTVWSELRSRTGLRLALDRGCSDHPAVDVLVVKPAVQEVPRSTKEIVITSYMDHPVGQLHAAHIASRHATSARCGLLTHLLFEPDPFIEQLRVEGTRLVPPEGTGIGFDSLLEGLPWRKLG